MNEKLVYRAADALQMNLYEIQGVLRGFETRSIDLGGLWNLKSDVVVTVDENTDALVSAFVRFRKNLWGYLVVTEGGQWLLFFDGDRAKIRVGSERSYGNGKSSSALKKIKDAVTGALSYKDGAWGASDPDVLLKGL